MELKILQAYNNGFTLEQIYKCFRVEAEDVLRIVHYSKVKKPTIIKECQSILKELE